MNQTIDPKDYDRIAKIVNRIAKHTALPDVVGPMNIIDKRTISEHEYSNTQGVFADWRLLNDRPTFPSSGDLDSVVIVIRYLLTLGVSVEDICNIILTTKYVPEDLSLSRNTVTSHITNLSEELSIFRNTVRSHMTTYQVDEGSMEPYFIGSSLHKDRITAMKGLLVLFCYAFDLHKVKPLYKRTLTYDIKVATTHYEHYLINDPRLNDLCEKIVKTVLKNPHKVNTVYKKYYAQIHNFNVRHTITSSYIVNPRLKKENRQELQRILVKIFEATTAGIKSFGTGYNRLRNEHIYYSEGDTYKAYEDMSVAELLLNLMHVKTYQLEDYMKRLFIIVALGEKLGFDLIDWYLGYISYDTKLTTIEENGWSL